MDRPGSIENFCHFAASILILNSRVFFPVFMIKEKLKFLYNLGSAKKVIEQEHEKAANFESNVRIMSFGQGIEC